MSDIIEDLTPLNLLEEKEKFLRDPTYNPQFTYVRSFTPLELIHWGQPKPKLIEMSQEFLKNRDRQPKQEMSYITEEQIVEQVRQFNEEYKLEDPIEVVFSDDAVVRCRVDKTHIFFQRPVQYTKMKFSGLYRHELETHILRRLNHAKFHTQETTKNEEEFRRTEEGLADLNALLFSTREPEYKTLLSYLVVAFAQELSFSEEYQKILELGFSERRAWNSTLRTKRGLTDTSQPGGFTKDIVYLEGSIQVWAWLMNPQHDPKDLYIGRFGLSEIGEHKSHTDFNTLLLPKFLQNHTEYLQNIREVGEVNSYQTMLQEVPS